MDRLKHTVRRLADCHNSDDFRALAKNRLPSPMFDYIDGAADDEMTKARNTDAYARRPGPQRARRGGEVDSRSR